MKKTLLLDCDGPCAAFVPALLEEMRLHVDEIPGLLDIFVWDFIHGVFSDKQKKLAYTILKDPAFWGRLPTVDGSKEAVRLLRECYDITWVTSRWHSCAGWDEARISWICKNFDFKPRDVIIASKKELIRGDVLVDDNVDNLRAWHNLNPHGKAMLFCVPCNRHDQLSWPANSSITWENFKTLLGD